MRGEPKPSPPWLETAALDGRRKQEDVFSSQSSSARDMWNHWTKELPHGLGGAFERTLNALGKVHRGSSSSSETLPLLRGQQVSPMLQGQFLSP